MSRWQFQQDYIKALQEVRNAASREMDDVQVGAPCSERLQKALDALPLAKIGYEAAR